jgi:polyisoprenoid-binding protein YceI
MNDHAKGKDFFNAEQFPTITYKGKSMRFEGDTPVEVLGELTMLGKTLPVNLKLNSFKCIEHPRLKREVCGADASTSFNRHDFGMTYASPKTGDVVSLQIQVEAVKAD